MSEKAFMKMAKAVDEKNKFVKKRNDWMIKKEFENFLVEQAEKRGDSFENTVAKFGFNSCLFGRGQKDTIVDKVQKLLCFMYMKDIKRLLQLSKEKQIDILFLKGLFMAADVYENIYERHFGDLDILVKEQDIYILKDILVTMGYHYQGYKDLMRQAKENHLKFIKKVTSQLSLMVETHVNICNPPYLYQKYTEIAWRNAGRQELLGLEPILLSPQDRILHSCIHFLNHCNMDSLYQLMGFRMPFRLQSVYDIALLIGKYGLDQEYLVSTSRRIHAEFDLYYALSVLEKIAPELVPRDMLLKLKETSMSSEVVTFNWLKNILMDELTVGQEVFDDNRPEKWLEKLPFEEHNRLEVKESEKEFFSFSNEDFEMKGKLSCVSDLIFRITWEKKNVLPMDFELVAHGYQKGENSMPCIKKYIIRVKDDFSEEITIKKPFEEKEVFDIRMKITERKEFREMLFYIPRYYFKNTVFLSMNVLYVNQLGSQDVCVTGKNWIDVNTMKSFVI